MQSYNNLPQRNKTQSPGINSKVSVPAGKVASTPNEPMVKSTGGSVKGFSGGVINPKVKC